jgi:hypothetical protein
VYFSDFVSKVSTVRRDGMRYVNELLILKKNGRAHTGPHYRGSKIPLSNWNRASASRNAGDHACVPESLGVRAEIGLAEEWKRIL